MDFVAVQIEVLGSSISRKLQAGNKVLLFVCKCFQVQIMFEYHVKTVYQGAFEPPASISVATLKGLWDIVKDKKNSYHSMLDARVSAFIGETFTHFDSDKSSSLRFDEIKACFRFCAVICRV